MGESADYAKRLNIVIANLPLIDKNDLSAFVSIIDELEKIASTDGTPKAFSTQAKRALALTNHIVHAEIDFEAGCGKLTECLIKLQRSIKSTAVMPESETSDTEQENPPPHFIPLDNNEDKSAEGFLLTDDMKELIIKFASSQQTVLEDFESYILEFEKGDSQATQAIKRILHTLKGEFGVLNLSEYAKFIHRIEELIEQNAFTTDYFFRLKDLLADKFTILSRGMDAPLTNTDKEYVCTALILSSDSDSSSLTVPSYSTSEPTPSPISATNAGQGRTTTAEIRACDISLINDFITESHDHLHTAETQLLEMETDPTNKENLNGIFRSWHTIKGISGFLGIREINTLAHKMENQMDLARKGDLALGPGPIDAFLEANDCLKALMAAVEEAIKGTEYIVPQKYDAILKRMSSSLTTEMITTTISPVIPAKKIGELLIDSGTASPEEVNHALEKQQKGDTRRIGEILVNESSIPAREVGSALAAQTVARQSTNIEETIRVPVNRIDQLVDSIGEAVIAQSMVNASTTVLETADQALMTKIAHANSIFRQIQELAMSLRMVSIKSTFQKMARLARDLSKKCGRDIEFVTEGEDTELDKSVVENIGDPLIHMIRNSIDHGIEPPDERDLMGKPRKAMVKLRAFHRAGSIFIEVIDDGRGLDRETIFKKAVNKGLCTADAVLSDQEVFQFIFLPGFSTAKAVTDISGRGVGMDVVRKNIEALRGSVEISSSPGKGSTFSIRLPLTLAIVDGMVVRSGTDRYIIPTLAILESIKPSADRISSVFGIERMIKVRDELIPLVHLGSLLCATAETWDINNGIIMIVEDMLGKKIGLFLDEIIGQQQVVIKNLGDGMGDIPGVTGGAIMSDGTVSLILDIGGIVKLAGEHHHRSISATVEEKSAAV